jgi:hypothetical protein
MNVQKKSCHPERSRTVSEASRPAKSKDPYFAVTDRRRFRFRLSS